MRHIIAARKRHFKEGLPYFSAFNHAEKDHWMYHSSFAGQPVKRVVDSYTFHYVNGSRKIEAPGGEKC